MVTINPAFRGALRDPDLSGFPAAQRFNFSKADALLRTQLYFAITLVHEFCHALFYAMHDYRTEPQEFFYGDHRIAELGFAFEQLCFSGMAGVTGRVEKNVALLAAPYGLHVTRWPGAYEGPMVKVSTYEAGDDEEDEEDEGDYNGVDGEDDDDGSSNSDFEEHQLALKSVAEAGVLFQTTYMLPVDYVFQFFTDRFWEHAVVQNMGLGARLRMPRICGVRVSLEDKAHVAVYSPQSASSSH